MKKPCKECPFTKASISGYLGGFTIEQTIGCAISESDFICHITRETKEEHQCIGRLLFATKTAKQFRRPDLEKMRNEAKTLNMHVHNTILSYSEFKEHHGVVLGSFNQKQLDYKQETLKLFRDVI